MVSDVPSIAQVIRICGQSARAMRTRVLDNMMETPPLEAGWRIGSPTSSSAMHKVRSFVVLHGIPQGDMMPNGCVLTRAGQEKVFSASF